MPRNNSTTPADLIGKLEWLRIECAKCGRSGQYRLSKMPPDLMLANWLADITKDCPHRIRSRVNINSQCGAIYPDLSKVL
jgi:hypothetical protein